MQMGFSAIAVDPVHDLIVWGGIQRGIGNRLLIFNRTDRGSVKPKAVIGGPKSGMVSIGGPFAIYPPRAEIIVSVRDVGDTTVMSSENCFVGVWSEQDNGDVPPRFMIGGPKGIFRMVRGVALDPRHKSVIVSDKRLNAVMTFYFPEMF